MSRKRPSPARIQSHLGTEALRHLKPEHIPTAMAALQEHLVSLPPEHLDKLSADHKATREYAGRFFEGCAVGSPETATEAPPADWREQTRSVEERPADWRGQSAAFQKATGHRWNT